MPTPFDEAFARVKQLVADFRANESFYLSAAYQEQEARRDFIDKFWMALGWDVNHDTQKNPFEQEVKVERKEHGVSQRRADYAFYLRPNFRDVKFYVEAKKPHGDIATADNYFQAIRYGWSSRTPLAVLNDFEQFEIVDSRFPPDIATALGRNVRKYHFSHYEDPEKFAEIYYLFSHEAVANGSLEKFVETLPKKRGKAVQRGLFKGGDLPMDETFLQELDEYRDQLAHSFKNRNPELDGETLTELTQRTLDRLVFLRFLEDKHIEPQNRIAYFGDKGPAWQDFIAESRRLDGIYNGIVYKEHAILDKPSFKVDDDIFSDICEKLSHLNSRYDFNAVPIHILGSIYERFLGKVITTTEKRAKVEEKPEVRKAGGVYYTPEYIVRYIVENTVGKLIEGKTPAQIAELRFADIACGSGSFLLGVYDLLIRYHTKYFNENRDKARIVGKTRKEHKADCEERDDGLHLTLHKKREILLNNIYGVDIDQQAVEVAQLSLYLKLLQDETPGSARQYYLDFEQSALLPTLTKNIVCGNSLIGTDILSGELFEATEERKLNPMDYEQRFPHIFRKVGRVTPCAPTAGKGLPALPDELRDSADGGLDHTMPGVPLHGDYATKKPKKGAKAVTPANPQTEYEGGFDAIVGNPPYVQIENIPARERDYFITRYGENATLGKRFDIYQVFLLRSIPLLAKQGKLGFILPNTFLVGHSYELLRRRFCQQTKISEVVDLPQGVFEGVTVDNVLLLLQREPNKQERRSNEITINKLNAKSDKGRVATLDWDESFTLKQSKIEDASNYEIRIHGNPTLNELFTKLESGNIRLGDITDSGQGIILYETAKQAEKSEYTGFKKQAGWKKLLRGKEIGRYLLQWNGEYVHYGRWLWRAREERFFNKPKILLHAMRNKSLEHRLVGTLDSDLHYNAHNLANIILKDECLYDLKYVLGLFNSRLINFWYKGHFPNVNINPSDFRQIPIRTINFSNPADKAQHDKLVGLVEQMLAAKKQLAAAQSDKDKDFYTHRCDGLDRQIDALVYDLYALTPEEIKIVEGAII